MSLFLFSFTVKCGIDVVARATMFILNRQGTLRDENNQWMRFLLILGSIRLNPELPAFLTCFTLKRKILLNI